MKTSLDNHEIEYLPLQDLKQVEVSKPSSFCMIIFWSRIVNLNITGVLIVTLLTF